MRNQRIDYKKKMKNRNRRNLMKRASTLTLATTLALSVPVTSLSLNVSGTQIVGSQTAYAQGGNLIDPRIINDVSIYKDNRGERVELQLSLSGTLNTSLADIGDQDLIFTVQLPDGFNNIFGTEEFANSFFYLAPNGPIVDSDGDYVVSLPEVTISEVNFDSSNNYYSFNLTEYLEKHNFSINEGDSAREVFNFVTRFASPVEGNEGENIVKAALTAGPANLNSLSSAVEFPLTLDPEVLWPDLPEEPGDGGEDPEEPGDGEEDPEEPSDGEEDPEEPGDGEEDPEEPGDGEEDPEEPGDGEEDPEEPSDGEEDPEEPSDGEEDPEEPGDGEEDPEEPGDGEEDPEEPGDGEEDPEEPGDGEEDPEEPGDGEEDPEEPGDGEEDPEEPGDVEEDPEEPEPSYVNRSLIDFTTEYDLFYSEQLGLGDLSLSQIAEQQVGLNFDQIDDLTYTLQLPEELGHILESDTFQEAGFFGFFNVPLVDENGDYVISEIEEIEDLEAFNQYIHTDHDTNSIHVELSKWADSLGYEITDEEYLYSQAINLSYDLEGVDGVHTIATAYTDGKLDLSSLDNQANLIEVDFDSGTDLPDIEPIPEPEPEPQPEPQPDGDDQDKDKVTPPGKKDGDKKDGHKKDHKDDKKDKKDKYKKDKSKDKEEGGALPKTATNDLAFALSGLAALLIGLAAKFSSRFRKA